jgi:arylsulfatase A-like enzyme
VLARHIDVVPTVLALLGLDVPRALPGRSLVAAARSGDDDVVGYFESRGPHLDLGWAAIEGVRTSRWKYTALPAPHELYDVLADPGETRDRLADEPAVAAQLRNLPSRRQILPSLRRDSRR